MTFNRGKKAEDVPKHVYGRETLFIDAEIRRRYDSRAPNIRPDLRYTAIPFGRRALATAIRAAINERNQSPPRDEWEPTWLNLSEAATQASKAADEFLSRLREFGGWVPSQPIDEATYVVALRRSRYKGGEHRTTSAEFSEMTAQASKDAEAIIIASKIFARVASDADRRRREATGKLANRGLLEKGPFIARLAEAWTFLTGRPPSKTPGKSPFDDFARAAWADWKGECDDPVSFVEATRNALKFLTPNYAAAISRSGPSWGEIIATSPQIRTVTDPLPKDLWGS